MFVLRNVVESDLDDLHELSQLLVFINLPHDRQLLRKQINKSQKSFQNPNSKLLERNYYIFVLEDLETKKVIGASMIHGKHGTKEEPHFYLKSSKEYKYSQSLNTGFLHRTLKFGLETNGYTEIGGLILDPSYRGNKERLGKQLSFVRFLYIGFHLDQFTSKIHTELMPPFDKEGNSPLWEAIGRRFLHMDYPEADKLSRANKEFILNLYPTDAIYETLLPIEVRNTIGKVGQETQAAKNMLEKIGFHYTEEIDPFDGGPHYRAITKEILPIKNRLSGKTLYSSNLNTNRFALVKIPHQKDFRAFCSKIDFQNGKIIIEQTLAKKVNLPENIETQAIYL